VAAAMAAAMEAAVGSISSQRQRHRLYYKLVVEGEFDNINEQEKDGKKYR
jgi:hypothetical protein